MSAGGVYGLIAIGHSLIYRLTGIVHFALGDLIGLGAFVTLLVAAGTQPLTQETVSEGRLTLAMVAGIAVSVLVGTAGYFAVVQPYIGRSESREPGPKRRQPNLVPILARDARPAACGRKAAARRKLARIRGRRSRHRRDGHQRAGALGSLLGRNVPATAGLPC